MQEAARSAGREFVEALARLGIVLARRVQMTPVALDLDARHERAERRPNLTDNAEIDRHAAPDRLRTDIDLGDARVFGIEGPIGKIRAEHQKRVAGFHGVIAGGEADQAGHADVVRIVPLDVVLAAQGVDDWRLHRFRELHQFIVRARAAAAAKKRYALRGIDEFRELAERLFRRRDDGVGGREASELRRGRGDGGFQQYISRDHHDAHTAFQDRPAHRDLKHARHLLGARYEFAIARTFLEQALGMGLLEEVGADLGGGDLRRDRHHRHAGCAGSRRGR